MRLFKVGQSFVLLKILIFTSFEFEKCYKSLKFIKSCSIIENGALLKLNTKAIIGTN